MKSFFEPHEVFRYGGDEFIIVSLEKITDERLEAFKERIRKIKMLENFDFSYGVATYPIKTKLEDLVHAASEEMKLQKQLKKNVKKTWNSKSFFWYYRLFEYFSLYLYHKYV